MPALSRRLPGLGALAVFEAAGRLTSFTHAAAELNVTQGAVSRQIRLLEDALGAPLFHRRHKSIELTAEGRRLHRTVAMALEQIAEAADVFRAGLPGHGVTIAATSAVATLWLIPRLGPLRVAVPNVEVQVLATDLELDSVADRFDIGIRYGTGRWPGFTAELLGHTEVFPVCAPSYLVERGPFAAPGALLGQRLLFLDAPRRHWIDWPLWLRGVGVTGPPPRPALRADSFTVLVNAAIEGQGVALGWRQLVAGHLANGLLVEACATRLHPDQAFYLVTRPDKAPSAECRAVADWIVAAFRVDSPPAANGTSHPA